MQRVDSDVRGEVLEDADNARASDVRGGGERLQATRDGDEGAEERHEDDAREPAVGSPFVSAYPPFSLWSPEHTPAFERVLASAPSGARLGLYAHVPFCEERCAYCVYLSRRSPRPDALAAYVDGLLAEARLIARSPFLAGRELAFVYIGGGTPSLLAPDGIARLLDGLRSALPWSTGAEVSFECAPRSATPERLRAMRAAGVTRSSMGIQALDDEVLRLNARIHTVDDCMRALDALGEAGFEVVNTDLIAGLVGETERTFTRGLGRLLERGPDSVTVYPLEIPENTPLFRALGRDALAGPLPAPAARRRRVALAFSTLEDSGYTRISAYAAVRDPERGRFGYQRDQYHGADVIGLGASAFAYLGGVHHQNIIAPARYLERIAAGDLPLGRSYALDARGRCMRELVLQLKLGRCDLDALAQRHGVDPRDLAGAPIASGERTGWWRIEKGVLLVGAQGLARIDRLLPDLYLPEHREPAH
ncbi:MAG: coproporphyrinogen-III oxidase family protein [Planctomycetota bacterium]|nr:coproporphyrinogen-III oxidase family protein [Planctomycetota bacterium]